MIVNWSSNWWSAVRCIQHSHTYSQVVHWHMDSVYSINTNNSFIPRCDCITVYSFMSSLAYMVPSVLHCVVFVLLSGSCLCLHFLPADVGTTCRCLLPGAGLKTWQGPTDLRRKGFKETHQIFEDCSSGNKEFPTPYSFLLRISGYFLI